MKVCDRCRVIPVEKPSHSYCPDCREIRKKLWQGTAAPREFKPFKNENKSAWRGWTR